MYSYTQLPKFSPNPSSSLSMILPSLLKISRSAIAASFEQMVIILTGLPVMWAASNRLFDRI
jgi:hypothetical protein